MNIALVWLGVDFGGDRVFSHWDPPFWSVLFSHQIMEKMGEKEGLDGSLPICLSHSSLVGFFFFFNKYIYKLITLGFFSPSYDFFFYKIFIYNVIGV